MIRRYAEGLLLGGRRADVEGAGPVRDPGGGDAPTQNLTQLEEEIGAETGTPLDRVRRAVSEGAACR